MLGRWGARGESTPTSEVDFLVEFEPGRSLVDQVHVIDDFGALLDTRVDVVGRGGLLDRDHRILTEAIPQRRGATPPNWVALPSTSAAPSSIPVADLAVVRDYCAERTPPQHRDEVRVERDQRGTSLTISERRPPWEPGLGPEWTRQHVAPLRYDPSNGHWMLYLADRNDRRHR